MKQAGYSKRPPSRSSERHRQHHKSSNGDFNDGKSRGNPQQSVERYLTLARDAASLGDPVSAENYYQYADHYYRLALANRISRAPRTERFSEEKASSPAPLENTDEPIGTINS
ncbi:MAG: DUF4167 domain-containing protein [Alphaproteobacteria bacterium]|nr:DUF4167 domain-containing protein [Alphaproteobacteria bacterium]